MANRTSSRNNYNRSSNRNRRRRRRSRNRRRRMMPVLAGVLFIVLVLAVVLISRGYCIRSILNPVADIK